MANWLIYKGYRGSVGHSIEDGVYYGQMMGIQSLVTYESPDIDGLEDAFQKAVDDYLETCRALCQAPDAPESLEEDLTS